MRSLDGSTDSMDMGMSKLQKLLMDKKPGVLQSMRSQTVGQDLETELNEDTLNKFHVFISQFEIKKAKGCLCSLGDFSYHLPLFLFFI